MKAKSPVNVGLAVGSAEGSGVALGGRAAVGGTGVLVVFILDWQALNSKLASVR
jgi:hypothetical protein